MSKKKPARYTLEFKLEAIRLVQGGQSIAAVARVLGVSPSGYREHLFQSGAWDPGDIGFLER